MRTIVHHCCETGNRGRVARWVIGFTVAAAALALSQLAAAVGAMAVTVASVAGMTLTGAGIVAVAAVMVDSVRRERVSAKAGTDRSRAMGQGLRRARGPIDLHANRVPQTQARETKRGLDQGRYQELGQGHDLRRRRVQGGWTRYDLGGGIRLERVRHE